MCYVTPHLILPGGVDKSFLSGAGMGLSISASAALGPLLFSQPTRGQTEPKGKFGKWPGLLGPAFDDDVHSIFMRAFALPSFLPTPFHELSATALIPSQKDAGPASSHSR